MSALVGVDGGAITESQTRGFRSDGPPRVIRSRGQFRQIMAVGDPGIIWIPQGSTLGLKNVFTKALVT